MSPHVVGALFLLVIFVPRAAPSPRGGRDARPPRHAARSQVRRPGPAGRLTTVHGAVAGGVSPLNGTDPDGRLFVGERASEPACPRG